ncbi:MAG: hypothetical protein ACK42L_07575, partial [Thermoanaerobaculum sp.]
MNVAAHRQIAKLSYFGINFVRPLIATAPTDQGSTGGWGFGSGKGGHYEANLVFFVAFVLLAAPALAQQQYGSIAGTVV